MPKHSWLLISVLSLIVIVVLSPAQAGVRAQAQTQTKTPIGKPPTKPPLVEVLPTKTPLPDAPATATSVPLEVPTEVPTLTPSPAGLTPVTPAPTSIASTATSGAMEIIVTTTSTPSVSFATALIGNLDPPAGVADPKLSLITQIISIGGFIFGLVILGLIIWLTSRAITAEIHTASLATLRLQHEAERLARREKVVFRADADVLALLEQAILDASGESVHVRLLPNGWVSSPPLMAVIDQQQTRYLFSPLPPDQVQDSARRQGLTQLLLGQATDLTAYPIDALNSTPFIVDDLSSAFGYVLARYQAPRRPLPRTDRWYLYIARPRTSHRPHWLNQRISQTGVLRRFTDRLPQKARSDSKPEQPTNTGD